MKVAYSWPLLTVVGQSALPRQSFLAPLTKRQYMHVYPLEHHKRVADSGEYNNTKAGVFPCVLHWLYQAHSEHRVHRAFGYAPMLAQVLSMQQQIYTNGERSCLSLGRNHPMMKKEVFACSSGEGSVSRKIELRGHNTSAMSLE